MREQDERKRAQNGADQEIRPPAAEAGPCAVAEIADDRLHQQPRDRARDPKDGQIVDGRAERLEYPADVRALQRKAHLDAEESERNVPELPKSEFWLHRLRLTAISISLIGKERRFRTAPSLSATRSTINQNL